MDEFTPITTKDEYQQRFNSDLGDRLRKNEEKWRKTFEGYLSPEDAEKLTKDKDEKIAALTAEIETARAAKSAYDKDIAEKNAVIANYELGALKRKIAADTGLSADAVEFLKGETEEDIKTSAESLKNVIGANKNNAPAFHLEPAVVEENNSREALRGILRNLNGTN